MQVLPTMLFGVIHPHFSIDIGTEKLATSALRYFHRYRRQRCGHHHEINVYSSVI
jgi:hypothetical protein